MAYLTHRLYHDDVAGMPLPQVIVRLLPMICKDLKEISGIKSWETIDEANPRIFDAHLIVAGGDVDNSSTAKTAFSLFNKSRMILQGTDDPDVTYLCHLLVNRTIVLQSVVKNLSNDDESDATETGEAIEYPSQWLRYSCITQQIHIGIRWSSNTDKFNLALLLVA